MIQYDTKAKELLGFWHFPGAKFGCNDFAAEQADNWGLTFALSQTPKLLHSSVLFCASLFKYLCLYFCWVIRAPNQSCLLPPISKSSIWHWLCIYVCYILFFLFFLLSSGKIASSPPLSWSIFGFALIFVFVCSVFVDFSVVLIEYYCGFDISPPPLCPPPPSWSSPQSPHVRRRDTNHPPTTITSLPKTYFFHFVHCAENIRRRRLQNLRWSLKLQSLIKESLHLVFELL